MKKINHKMLANLENVIILVFLLITFFVMKSHELWRDEAQQWLLIKNLSFHDLLSHLYIEGHPFVWYLVLKGYSLLNLPYHLIGYLSWGICGISAIILMKKINLNLIVKIVVLGSVTFLFYCSVFSRSYSLVLLEIILLIVYYPKRKEKPICYNILLALLVNTHILVFGFVGALLAIEIFEIVIKKEKENRKKRLIGIIITIIGFILLFAQLLGASRGVAVELNNPWDFISILDYTLIAIFNSGINNIILTYVAFIVFIYLILYLIYKKKGKELFIIICSVGFQLVVFSFIYSLNYYMGSVFFAILLFIGSILYIEDNNRKWITAYLFITFACSVPIAIKMCYTDIQYRFSNAYYAASYINKNINANENIYCDDPIFCSAIIPYTKNKFIDANSPDFKDFTYIDWHKQEKIAPLTAEKIASIKKNGGKIIVVHFDDILEEMEKNEVLEILYNANRFNLCNENYKIVKIK